MSLIREDCNSIAIGDVSQVVQWDLAVEKDTRAEQEQEQKQQQPEGESSNTDPNVPPQLLFIHQV